MIDETSYISFLFIVIHERRREEDNRQTSSLFQNFKTAEEFYIRPVQGNNKK